MALLHICWQNSAAVRNEFTYRITYGDKESYWFGLELCAVPFFFEDHYGSIVGEVQTRGGVQSVCSFTIAHVDEKAKLLWYNGSSLINDKLKNQAEFLVSDVWMIDGDWVKGATKQDLSCMQHTELRRLDEHERRIVAESVVAAREADVAAEARGFGLIADSTDGAKRLHLPSTIDLAVLPKSSTVSVCFYPLSQCLNHQSGPVLDDVWITGGRLFGKDSR